MSKKNVIAARNLKDWTKFTTQMEIKKENQVFSSRQFFSFPSQFGKYLGHVPRSYGQDKISGSWVCVYMTRCSGSPTPSSSQPCDRTRTSVPGTGGLIVRVVVSETCSDTRVDPHSDKLHCTRSTYMDTPVIGIISEAPRNPDTLHVIGEGRERGFKSPDHVDLT
jgi:hypothetical protein